MTPSPGTISGSIEPVTSPGEVRVIDNPASGQFEAWVGDEVAGFAEYRQEPGRLIFTHTVVEAAFEGTGVGSRLAAAALDEARARGLSVVPQCPFIAGYIRRHPAYQDLVAAPLGES